MTAPALAGARVTVLRTGDGPDAIAAELRTRGAMASTVVVARTEDRSDEEVARGVGDLSRFAWVALTSANAGRRLAPWSGSWPSVTRIGVVGPATRDAVIAVGLTCDVTAPGGTARDLARLFDQGPVLFLAASSARTDLADELGARDIDVTTVVTYDVQPRPLHAADLDLLSSSDAVVVTSALAVDALQSAAATRAGIREVRVVAIGPSTQAHADAAGWRAVTAVDRTPTAVSDAVRAVLDG